MKGEVDKNQQERHALEENFVACGRSSVWQFHRAHTKPKKNGTGHNVGGHFKEFEKHTYTHLKFNISPENRPSQKETSIPTINFQRLC